MNPFDKEAYDECYTTSEKYKQHYKDVIYFNVWNYVMSNLQKIDKIVDLGCGPGHMLHMLYDNGFKTCVGIDFSKVGIEMAKLKVPSYIFIEADLRNIDYSIYKDFKFISIETFEHLENDIELIKKLPQNHIIIFSVPNYRCIDHYRIYPDVNFIQTYYKDVLNIISIKPFWVGGKSIIYVVEASIK